MPEPVLLRWVGLRSVFLSRGTGHSCCWAPCFTPSPSSTGALAASRPLPGLALLLGLLLRPLLPGAGAVFQRPGIRQREALWLPPGHVQSVLEELRGPAPSAPREEEALPSAPGQTHRLGSDGTCDQGSWALSAYQGGAPSTGACEQQLCHRPSPVPRPVTGQDRAQHVVTS